MGVSSASFSTRGRDSDSRFRGSLLSCVAQLSDRACSETRPRTLLFGRWSMKLSWANPWRGVMGGRRLGGRTLEGTEVSWDRGWGISLRGLRSTPRPRSPSNRFRIRASGPHPPRGVRGRVSDEGDVGCGRRSLGMSLVSRSLDSAIDIPHSAVSPALP